MTVLTIGSTHRQLFISIYQFARCQAKVMVQDAGSSIVIMNLPSALKSLDTIVIQGEGSPSP